MPGEQLPEGTDAIVTGAGVDASDAEERYGDASTGTATGTGTGAGAATQDGVSGTAAKLASAAADAGEEAMQSFSSRIEGLKGQATDRARGFVEDAKARATESIDGIVQMINDAAAEVDDKVGRQYGDYVRRAAESVSGLSDGIREKDVDSLFTDARDLVQKAPGVAIGAAAAFGFVLARLARAGTDTASTAVTGQSTPPAGE